MRSFLQSEMRGDGSDAPAGGGAAHEGERRGRPREIDYRTVVRLVCSCHSTNASVTPAG